ncbi:ATP-binding protein [Sporomusa aerivorans]|uniref:ATP-binding protein n=1 Tax=Sporomusa aerivorans TaxID=204936 RepID=UPI00352B76FF
MKYFFAPAVQLMNRLKYAYKFAVIGILIILQAAVLIYMLVSNLNKNIEMAAQERSGVQFIQAVLEVFEEGQAYRNIHYAYLRGNRSLESELRTQQAKVDAALNEVEAIEKGSASQLDAGWKLQTLRQDWLARKQDAMQFEAERAQVAFDLDSRWLREVTDLMQQAGYGANLAMDSDSDIAYLVDSVLRKMPGLVDTLGVAQGLTVDLFDEDLSTENRNHLLQVIGLVRSSMEQADYNVRIVFRHNDNIKTRLGSLYTALTDAVPIFSWNFEQKTVGQQGLPVPRQLLTITGSQAFNHAVVLHKEELQVIDEMLAARIAKDTQYRNAIIIFSGGILLIVCYLFLGFDMSVRKGVYQLDHVMKGVGRGDLAIRGQIYSRDEMGSLTQAINGTLDALQKMYEEVQESHDQLSVWNQKLEQTVTERTAALRNLLDHAGQGFLSFGEDLKVSREYSAECTAIFQRDLAGESIARLLYPDEDDQQAFLEAVFGKIFQEKNKFLRETYLTLLPEEIVLGSCYIGVAYKLIQQAAESNQTKIMLILTDLTIQKEMENQVRDEKDTLAMIVHVVTHSTDFFATVNQYRSFCQEELPGLLRENKPAGEILTALFRIIHTFKGAFGQLRMRRIMSKLHDLESWLDNLRTNETAGLDRPQLLAQMSGYTPETMINWLNEDLDILQDKLGENFFQRENTLVIDNTRLLAIEEKVQHLLPPAESGLLLADLRRLRYRPIKELLQSYPEYVCSLAERNEKAVHAFAIEGGETLVDPMQYYDFIQSLGHVFRNSVVHGLESVPERLENGKEEFGAVRCSITESEAGLHFLIADDGRGIDPARIRDIAVEKGICTQDEANSLQAEDWVQFIFADNFSGASHIDELAGRGVGLGAVRAELDKLGGSVNVHTALGKGTQFNFFLPFDSAAESFTGTIQHMSKALLEAAKVSLYDAGLQVTRITYLGEGESGKVNLRKFSNFLGVKGILNGKILLSYDQRVAEYLFEKLGQPDSGEETSDERMENALLRHAQKIFGQATRDIPGGLGTITAETLVSILAEDASVKYPQVETPTWVFYTSLGNVNLSLIY